MPYKNPRYFNFMRQSNFYVKFVSNWLLLNLKNNNADFLIALNICHDIAFMLEKNCFVYQRNNQSLLRAFGQRSFHCEQGAPHTIKRGRYRVWTVLFLHRIPLFAGRTFSCNIKNIIYAVVSVPSAKHAQKCCTEVSYVSMVHSFPAGGACDSFFFSPLESVVLFG